MTATLFRLQALESGRHLAWAVVCPEARYCSVLVPTSSVLQRRHAGPHIWKNVELDFRLGLSPGPLAADMPLVTLITDGLKRSVVVQYVTARPFAASVDIGQDLDAWLHAQAAA